MVGEAHVHHLHVDELVVGPLDEGLELLPARSRELDVDPHRGELRRRRRIFVSVDAEGLVIWWIRMARRSPAVVGHAGILLQAADDRAVAGRAMRHDVGMDPAPSESPTSSGALERPALPDTRPPGGTIWDEFLALPARSVSALRLADVPTDSGVYLWRHEGRIAYVGKAKSLRKRAWSSHLGGGASLGSSSLRRNVAEFLLGIPTIETIKGRRKLTPDEVDAVRGWLRECEISWQVVPTPDDAADLEDALRAVWWPPLNRV